MEAFFNELSLPTCEHLTYEQKDNLKKSYKAISSYIKTCRIGPAEFVKLIACADGDPNLKSFLFAFFKEPYNNEDLDRSEEQYLKLDITCNNHPCIGIAASKITDSLTFSIFDYYWSNSFINILVNNQTDQVRNVSTPINVADHIRWLESLGEIDLVKCELSPEKKEIRIHDDHGKEILREHALKLVRSPYVVKIVNSLPYNSKERNYIRSIKENGLIEIVLFWTDKGLGLVIQTTGRNFRETEKISKLLKKDYGKR